MRTEDNKVEDENSRTEPDIEECQEKWLSSLSSDTMECFSNYPSCKFALQFGSVFLCRHPQGKEISKGVKEKKQTKLPLDKNSIIFTKDFDQALYKTLLESTRAIPWQIDWATQKFKYIGPQIEELLGWSQTSWVSANDWADRMHPDDSTWVVNYCVAQSTGGIDHEADYRALTKDGQYVWIRDVVHVIKNNGTVESLVGFMFDITERKQAEEELLRLQKELEELSFQDGLTGIPNKRMFNQVLNREWHHSQRNQQPLSLVLFDIDFFKQYNDYYGHQQGDECLRQIGQTLSKVTKRATDLIARFGGEEFALLLPQTNHESAIELAKQCCHEIALQQIPHETSLISDIVTISGGVSTIKPSNNMLPSVLIEMADKLLYQAKNNGRNRIEHQ